MEGTGGWAAGGGHVLRAAQEPLGLQQQREQEEKEAGAATERKKGGGNGGGGGVMKFRVRARAPHGVGALLLIGGAAVVGAAVLAWRRSYHGNKGGAVDQPDERRLPANEEALDGGIVEDGKGASLVQKLVQSDENLSAGNTDIGSGSLDGNVSEESHQIHKDDEITAEQLEIKHEEKIDENSGSNPVEVHTHDLESKHEEKIDGISGSNPAEVYTHNLDKEHVEEVEHKSSCNHVEVTAHDMCQDTEHVEKIDHVEEVDQNSISNPVKIIMQEMVNVYLVSGSVDKVEKDSSKKDIEKEIAQKDNKDMEAPDQSKLCIKGPGIILSKHNDESDGAQEAESMENTPTAQLLHQDQLLDDMVTDTVTETEDTVTETEDTVTEPEDTAADTEDTVTETEEAKQGERTDTVTEPEDTAADTEDTVTETEEEAKQGERTITDESELKQDEKKDLVGLVELASSPALSSLVKPIVKKEPEFPRPNETGMKLDQDYTNGELSREHTDLISKGGAMRGEGDMATMDCRSSAMIVIALIFALTMGITIIVRLYAPSRATKLQMDLP